MAVATVRFYAELNDFLPAERRQRDVVHTFEGGPSVKDLVESLGVPHTEVDLILVNGRSVDFSHHVADGDRISVYPVFEGMDITPVVRLRPRPLREPRFVVDGHLGKLASYLRLLGFDTLYRNDAADEELARTSATERRILLTRDLGLLKRREVTHGYAVRSTEPRRQLAEVVERFDLKAASAPFTRCLACNGRLEAVPKAEVADRLPPLVRGLYDDVFRCAGCAKVYWKGSHYDRMRALLGEVLGG